MANECMNYITIKGNRELLQIFADSYLVKKENGEYGLDFNVIEPIPKDIAGDDYHWRIVNWGNKWDGTNGYVALYFNSEDEAEIYIDVATAWSPCEPIVYTLISLCPGLYFHHEYYEPGEGYVGYIEHNANEDPEDAENVHYHSSYDPIGYWCYVFKEEHESFDWLTDYIEEQFDYKEITEEQRNHLFNIINENYPIEQIVQDCIEFNIL